jgi:hypothetical protein
MKAVCNGDSQCPENSGSCSVTPLSLTCGNCVLDELSKRICNNYNPRNCKELEGVFSYNGLSGGECGIVNGSYFSHGRTYVSGDPDIFNALCVDCHGTSCSGKYKYLFFFSPYNVLAVNGGLNDWSTWSSCSGTCTKERSRSCTNPTPLHGGNGCTGKVKDEKPCSDVNCKVHSLISQ